MTPIVVRKRWWMPPWGKFTAITIYPLILLAPGWKPETLRHELIHCWQVRRDGWLRFYARYLWLWITGTKYADLPAELEAYWNQYDPTFLPTDLEALVRGDA